MKADTVKKRNVLVFPAGTEIGLEIFHALTYCKEVKLFGAGQNISNHAEFLYPEYHILPSIYENGWVDELSKLCEKLEIDYIFPAYDDVLVALSREADKLSAKVITSPLLTCEITRSKSRTYNVLKGRVNVPAIYESANEVSEFPVFVKPDRGQGSYGVTKAIDADALARAVSSISEPIICEYLPGDEYTVDCFSDREKGVLFCGARRRCRTRNGISVNTITEDLPEIKQMANHISEVLNLRGAWFFQVKRAINGELTLLEVAPRIAGAMASHRVMGVNFPLLSIFEEERLPISVNVNLGGVELDRALSNRYRHSIIYSFVYIDLDDTLIIDNKVNEAAMAFVFKCINNKKKVILLTRHRGNLSQTLLSYRLNNIFDEVIHIDQDEKKSSYIKIKDAIFIDDSFAERMDVADCCHIPTFDCSMIEMLLNDTEMTNLNELK